MGRDLQRFLLFIVLMGGTACSKSSERIPQRYFEEGLLTSNKTYSSANKGCYAFNQDEFGRNLRLLNISCCHKKLRHPPDSYVRADL